MLKNDANVNAQDDHGTAPIHLAAYRDNVVAAEKLMQSDNLKIDVCGTCHLKTIWIQSKRTEMKQDKKNKTIYKAFILLSKLAS